MKNYKLLVPVVLIALFLCSIYMLSSTKVNDQNAYEAKLEEARDYYARGILVDALKSYQEALSMQDSVELWQEIGNVYLESELLYEAEEWGEDMASAHPRDVRSYEYQIRVYEQAQDYMAFFDTAEKVAKRQLQSDEITAAYGRLEYTYYFSGNYDNVQIFSGGYCPVEEKGVWGYVNDTGKQTVKFRFLSAGPFIEGMAPVTDQEGNSYFIDPEGNKKHAVMGVDDIEQLGLIERGLFPLYNGKEWNFYNTKDELIFGGFDAVSACGNGVAAVQKNGKWSLVDREGKDLTGETYTDVCMDGKGVVFRNDRIFVHNGKLWQMIDKTGEVYGDAYEAVHLFNDATYAAVCVKGKWGFVDKDGNVVIEPQFEDAGSFSGGLAAVMKDGLWGFVDQEGTVVVEPQFEDARDFNTKGCAFVFLDGQWKLLRLYKFNH